MFGERLTLPTRCLLGYGCWERRIGFRLDRQRRAYDPVQENNRRLFPNDPHEARRPFAHWGLMTSHRSLVRPFTPIFGFRLSPTVGE
jgi:hypothetical protein